MPAKVAFLDRDGTLNVDHGYVYRVSDWQFTDRAMEALQWLKSAGFRLALVTNQSGIARGFYRLQDMLVLHEHMQAQLSVAGLSLDAVAFCPHGEIPPCDCRK